MQLIVVYIVAFALSSTALFSNKNVQGRNVKGMRAHNCAKNGEQCDADVYVRSRAMDASVTQVHDTISTGRLNCSDLYDHKPTWSIWLGSSNVTAQRLSFQESFGGHYTWCGTGVNDTMTTVCATWHSSMVGPQGVCDPSRFLLTVRSHIEGGNVEYRSLPYQQSGDVALNGGNSTIPKIAIY